MSDMAEVDFNMSNKRGLEQYEPQSDLKRLKVAV